MATQNIAINTGESAGFLLGLASHIFEVHGEEIGNAATTKNFISAYLKTKGSVTTEGGLDIAEPVLISTNGNFAMRDKYSQIAANIADPVREFRFDWVQQTGSIAINEVHKLQNMGKAQIKKLLETYKMQAETTIANIRNASFWKASPVANLDSESLQSIVSTTPTSGSLGGISRANTYAQNKVSNTTISSIGSAAGLALIHAMRITLGGDAKTIPDFAVTTPSLYANLQAFLDTLRQRYMDETMGQLGFDTIKIGPQTTLGFDGNGVDEGCPANRLYFLNSKHLFFRRLSGGMDRFTPFEFRDNSWNATSLFLDVFNLTTNLPSSMGVFTAITG